MLNDAYALFNIPVFRNSVREEQRNPKKIYAIDNGFKMIFSASISQDDSKLYENTVFLQLRRQTREVYYFKQKQEVDFYAVINQQKILANVSYNIAAPETRKREVRGLVEAMDYFNCSESLLITRDTEEIIEVDGYTIKALPLWRWLLFADTL